MRSIGTVFSALALTALLLSGPASALDGALPPSVRVGDVEVVTLTESINQGKTEILIGASSDDLAKFVPDGTFPLAVNAFLVRAGKRVVLIDTGFGDKLFDNLASRGVAPADVTDVLITHSHADHIGGLLRDGKPSFPRAAVHIAEAEYEWSEALREKLAEYASVKLFSQGTFSALVEPVPGILAIAAYGHTPGHTAFQIENKGEKLLIWGDLVHAAAIQMPRPGVSMTYDSDPAQAAEVRRAILEYAARDKVPVAGMHIAPPGFGQVLADENNPGGYVLREL